MERESAETNDTPAPATDPRAASAPTDAMILAAVDRLDGGATAMLLMRRYGDDVAKYCRSMLRDEFDADDAWESIFVKAVQNIGAFQRRSSLKTWLFRISYNHCISFVRSRDRAAKALTRLEYESQVDGEAITCDVVHVQRLKRALNSCMDTLSIETATALTFHYQQSMSFDEIAVALGGKPETWRKRVQRALPKLRDCISRKAGGGL